MANIANYLVDYGVDYVTDSYGHILELIRAVQEACGLVPANLLTLEMLYNLLIVYTPQLRENYTNIYTLVGLNKYIR